MAQVLRVTDVSNLRYQASCATPLDRYARGTMADSQDISTALVPLFRESLLPNPLPPLGLFPQGFSLRDEVNDVVGEQLEEELVDDKQDRAQARVSMPHLPE